MKLALPGSLLAASAVLVAGIGYELLAPLGPVAIDAPRAPLLHPSVPVAAIAPPSVDLFADIDARPLFNPKRTPLADSGLAGSASGASDLMLIGVMIGGEKPIALFKSASASTTATVGDVVNGMRVVDIAPTQVTLRGSSGLVSIPLASLGSQTPSAPLPAPVAAAAAEPAAAPQSAPTHSDSQPTAAAQPVQEPATLPAAPTATTVVSKPPAAATANAPTAVTVSTKPALPAPSGNGTIAAEALKGAPIDPKTGQPTL